MDFVTASDAAHPLDLIVIYGITKALRLGGGAIASFKNM